jgi:hypothetical protein
VLEPSDQAIAAPKFNVVSIDELAGEFERRIVIRRMIYRGKQSRFSSLGQWGRTALWLHTSHQTTLANTALELVFAATSASVSARRSAPSPDCEAA